MAYYPRLADHTRRRSRCDSRHRLLATSLTRLGLVDEYQLTTVPIAIGAGRSPFAELEGHLKLDVVDEERFSSGALAQILVPKR